MRFALGKPFDREESLSCEFKEVKGQSPIQAIGSTVDRYMVAFLNDTPGSIFWGIRDTDREVVGVRLAANQRDELLQVIGQKISSIAPQISADRYSVPFHQVVDSGEVRQPVKDTFVVEVRVHEGGKNGLYLTGSGEAYRKTVGGVRKLSGAELINVLLMQLQSKVEQSSEEVDLSWAPSVSRRAKVVRQLLKGARALWVDDNPINNIYERTVLNSFGISADIAISTDEALYFLGRLKYDLILSDMNRHLNPRAGLSLLNELRRRAVRTPVVFYVGDARELQLPAGAFAITDRPDALLHYIFDVLERR